MNASDALPIPAFEQNIVRVAKGGGIITVGKIFLYASRFVIAVLLARLLGAEQYGLYNIALSIGTLATGIALFGLHSALVRFVAVLAGRRDEAGLWGALQVALGLSFLLSVVIGTGLYALSFLLAEQVFHEPRIAPLLQLIGLFVPSLVLSDVLAGAHRGFKQQHYPVIAQSVTQPIVRLVLMVLLAISGLDAARAVVIYGLADLIAAIMLLYFLNKQFSLRRPVRAARRDVRGILSYAVPDWLADLMFTFRGNIQTLLLGALNTVTSAGVFSVANSLQEVGQLIHTGVNTSARPFIAELHDRGDVKQLGRLYQTITRWTFTINLPVFLVTVLFPGPILSIFGESFTTGATALAILAWSNLVNVGTGMGGIILEMTGYMRLKLVNSVIRLVLSLTLSVLLIPRWGIVGAAAAALVSETVINLIRLLEVFILFRLLPYSRSFIKPIVAGLAALVVAWIMHQWLAVEANPIVYTAIHAFIILAVYMIMIRWLGLSAEEQIVLKRMRHRAGTLLTRS